MKITKLIYGNLKNNTYVVTYEDKSIIIDATSPVEDIKQVLGESKVVGVLLTHAHFDHMTNIVDIVNAFDTSCYMHPSAYKKLMDTTLNGSKDFGEETFEIAKDKCQFVQDGQELNMLNKPIKVVYTPGHTDCGICYVIEDTIFSGDTIFCDGVGRTDLPTGDFGKLFSSIKNIKQNYINYHICAGHGPNGRI